MTRTLSLPDLPTFVINGDPDGERRSFMQEQCERWELEYEFVGGVLTDPICVGGSVGHLNALRHGRGRTPFVVLEDDCLLYDIWGQTVELPDDARMFYPGISVFGIDQPGSFSWGQYGELVVERYDHRLLRVGNMLGAHAVVFLDDEMVDLAADAIWEALTNPGYPFPVDVALAKLHHTHLALASRHPMCEQAAAVGGQWGATHQTLLAFVAADGQPSDQGN